MSSVSLSEAVAPDAICDASCEGLDVIPAPDGSGEGVIEKLDDMDVYVVGTGERAIVLIYDIFGFAPANTRHNCDLLARAGFLVVMPDLFRGKGRRSPDFVRPQNDDVDAEILDKVVPFTKAKGAKVLGLVGFCFGGGAAMRVASSGVFAAVGGLHASGLQSPDGEAFVAQALCPIMLLQAGNDPSLEPVAQTVAKMKSINEDSVLRTFWDQRHGWSGATGDRTGNPRLKEAVESALSMVIKFFTRLLVVPPEYTLHVYDHCPFCVKAELALGFCGVKYDRKVWGYGEGAKPVGDFAGSSVVGPAGLINAGETEGVKGLPILEVHAEPAARYGGKPFMRESSDIIAMINEKCDGTMAAKTGAGMEWKQQSTAALGQLTTVYKFQAPLNLAGDYKHAEDIAYGQQKYAVRGGGKYVMCEQGAEESPKLATVADEAALLAEANESLQAFEMEVLPQLGAWGLDDVEILPTLRNATCIPGLVWPAATRKYVEDTCAKGGVPTYFASEDTA